jgi:PAS domain S-box-containing protein
LKNSRAFRGTSPAFLRLLRKLHGLVPKAVLCVDATGCIRVAALPASIPVSSNALERRFLQEFVHETDASQASWLAKLKGTGRARVALDLPSGELLYQIDADVILIEAAPDDAVTTPHWDLAPGLVDAAPVPLLGMDVTGRIRVANAACQELLGYSRQELLGLRLASLIEDEKQTHPFNRNLSHGICEATRVALRRKDGQVRTVDLAARQLAADGGEAQGWAIEFRKTTGTPDMSAQRSEELERCIRSVVHDLRSPLGSLHAFADLLERDFGARLDELGQRYIEQLRCNVDRVQNLFDDLLEYAQIRSIDTERSLLAPREVFEQLARELKPELEQRLIRLVLPDAPAPVYADPLRFRQVLLNLVLNAVHHMGDVETPRIRIQVEPVTTGTVVEVSDNGDGIPPEEHVHIFELFANGRGGREGRGRGLGLSIVKRIMDAHGGRIDVESAPGAGATFRAFFPGP